MLEVVAIPFDFAQGTLPLRSLSEVEGKLILHKAGSIVHCIIGSEKSYKS